MKTAVALSKHGLCSSMLVKTTHKDFPCLNLGENALDRGEWVACRTTIRGAPRVTKHCGNIPHPQAQGHYLKYATEIDFHNHYCLGGVALEDI